MIFLDNAIYIVKGVVLTMELMVGGMFMGLVLGTLLAICKYKGWMVELINRFVSIARGTPLILQLSFFYFALPSILKIQFPIELAGILTLGFNSAAYIAEILRAGIESLPKGQFEAAISLQIPTWSMWKDIILPQVIKNVFPALINEMITLLKETALISTIGGMDLMRRAQSVAAEQFTYFMPICIAGLYYYLLILLIETISQKLEKGRLYVKNS
ncbi:MAG: amino acid ABC transporter permease [Proteobacteria bacterium]|nr:amino acid ABC transporter permease [Pseudomonadota bacterium]